MPVQDVINDLVANPSLYTAEELKNIVTSQSTNLGNTNGTILYSGGVGNAYSGDIALNIANQEGLAIINNTDASKVASSIQFRDALLNSLGEDITAIDDPNSGYNKFLFGENNTSGNRIANGLWDDLSHSFITDNATGDVRVIAPFADSSRIFSQIELPALLGKEGVTSINGMVKTDISNNLTDALLVFDKNGNGTIDGIDELFGNDTLGGFDELALLDTDGNPRYANDNSTIHEVYESALKAA